MLVVCRYKNADKEKRGKTKQNKAHSTLPLPLSLSLSLYIYITRVLLLGGQPSPSFTFCVYFFLFGVCVRSRGVLSFVSLRLCLHHPLYSPANGTSLLQQVPHCKTWVDPFADPKKKERKRKRQQNKQGKSMTLLSVFSPFSLTSLSWFFLLLLT